MRNISVQVHLVQVEQNVTKCHFVLPEAGTHKTFPYFIDCIYSATKMTTSMYCKHKNLTHFTTF